MGPVRLTVAATHPGGERIALALDVNETALVAADDHLTEAEMTLHILLRQLRKALEMSEEDSLVGYLGAMRRRAIDGA